MKNSNRQENSILMLLRLCTFFLAAVSFWATAQGMIDYTFPESWQAYAASLGIQGLLLGLNFALPSFLKQSEKPFQKVVLLFLSAVILFCSSWFSYLYIAKQAYGESWATECRLLAQAVYRNELFAADVYTEQYSTEMQGVLADQVVTLYQQAAGKDQNKVNVSENLLWEEERSKYAADNSAARDTMLTVIDAMEKAMEENAPQDVREQAASILSGLQSNLQLEINGLSGQIETEDERVAQAETTRSNAEVALQNAQNRVANGAEGINLTYYENAARQATENWTQRIARRNELESQRDDLETAQWRINYYLTILGMAESGVSSYFVGANLREIQKELFEISPNSERMRNLATEIFERLQSAIDLGEDTAGMSEYQSFLSMMNSFVQNLDNYRAIKESNDVIQKQLDMLANGEILSLDARQGNADWQSIWQEQFNDLKSTIGGLPVYTLEHKNDTTLSTFDRTNSTRNLDQAIRRYLTNHNAAQEGLIYLASPYRGVAVFSLLLALLLDIAAFITGVIIERVSSRREKEQTDKPVVDPTSINLKENTEQVEHETAWSIVPGLNRYVFLTGDYFFADGVMTYKAIENGEEIAIENPDKNLSSGLYRLKANQIYSVDQALFLFKGASGGPQDGVYTDCILHYENQLLALTQSGKSIVLGYADPHTPVYQLSKDQYEVLPAKNISDTHGQVAIIALNKEGIRIIAIYVLQP